MTRDNKATGRPIYYSGRTRRNGTYNHR